MMDEFNHFGEMADAFGTAISQVVRKTAFDLQATAISFAPVDTGFLKNSIYVVTQDHSDYGSGGFLGKGDAELLDEVDTPDDAYSANVAVGANYGIYVEMGTRYQPAQPYFFPAVEFARGEFEDAMAAIEDKLGGS